MLEFPVVNSLGVNLPEGVVLVEAVEFMTSWEKPNDVLTQRLVLCVNGRNVQAVRYAFDPENVLVMVDGKEINTVPLNRFEDHISGIAKL